MFRSIQAADAFHLWTVGDRVAGDNAVLFNLSPGNVKGYGWIGASTSSLDPVGWIDFSCANQGSCGQQLATFGADVGVDIGKCREDITRSCLVDGDCGTVGPCDPGVITGSAWLGNQDPTEIGDFGKCQNLPSGGTCDNGACSNNPMISCNPGDNAPCLNTNCSTTCAGNSNILCSNNSQCFGTCEKNQGFRCLRDSDCQVSCTTNPLACRTTGWLSFDKSITDTPPGAPYNDANQSYIARFDQITLAIDGWARLQLGQCSGPRRLTCFTSNACPSGETCDYSSAYPGQGWVKLRGNSGVADRIAACSACQSGSGPSDATCGICTSFNALAATAQPSQYSACNSCSGCTLKRCNAPSDGTNLNPCSSDIECNNIAQSCQPFGSDFTQSQGGGVCFSQSDPNCVFGADCAVCSRCSEYGASIDTVTTKQFTGSAWSPDLGWIDLSRARIGGQLFFATQFGSIYAGGNIGSSTTTPAPGFPGGTAAFCNATYRIIATGTITNFCSNAQLAPPAGTTFDPQQSPYIYPQYPTPFIFPSAANRYTSQIGTLDLDGLTTAVTSVANPRNKFGNPVLTVDKNPAVSDEDIDLSTDVSSDMNCAAGPCQRKLLGKVYHIKGNLVIDKDYRFDVARSSGENGSGTFVIDGKLILKANLSYYDPQLEQEGVPPSPPSLGDRRQLPSVAFLVKDSVEIDPAVTSLVGVFYTEQTVDVTGSGGSDNSLTVSGLMVAQNFRLERRYVDPSGVKPAELVIYDGRLQANTPPGLEFLSKALPSVQELAP